MIIDSRIKGKGYGSEILNIAKQKNSDLNGWVIDQSRYLRTNGEVYYSPLDFYLKNGFKLFPNQRLELDNISAVKIQWSRS